MAGLLEDLEYDGDIEKHYIKTEEWMPNHKPQQYPASFVRWVDSINKGWRNKLTYKPYDLYVEQANQWLNDTDDISKHHTVEDQEDYVYKEYMRCKENTLYFANKYGKLKDGNSDDGTVDYKAWEAQQILLFLFDCGYNCMIGKARQIGFTTTMGLAAMKRINFNTSYFCKFITHNREKGEEIFRDKIRWGFGKIPDYLKEEVYNDSHSTLSLQEKTKEKGKTVGSYSRIQVDTPAIDSINGGSPNLVLIDEIGLFELFGKMVTEGRPTLFYFNPETGHTEMRRQLMCWGTGGEMDKGGAVFESEFRAALKSWKEKDFKHGIIPLFFDAFARQGVDEEMYKAEKKVYYSKTGVDEEISKVQFHQHYPITLDDMFLRTSKTIIPIDQCNSHIARINGLDVSEQPQYGYFEPVYDVNSPTPDGVLPYRLVDSRFIPTEGMEDPRTTAVIFKHPPHGEMWEYRYYQGTDPINSETGHSKMSSSIWDAYANTISSVVFWRTRDFKQCYLQCVLQGLYYGKTEKIGVKELIESNIGDMYLDFQKSLGIDRRVVPNAALEPYLQGASGKWWGISNKASTAGHIANKIIEMIDGYAHNIYIYWIFEQIKTFVEKDLKGNSTHRQTRFQAADLKSNYDDAIFSATFAYINAQCHSKYIPARTDEAKETRKLTRYVQSEETGWRLRLAQVNENGKVLRYLR